MNYRTSRLHQLVVMGAGLILLPFMTSCDKSEPDSTIDESNMDRVILVYAVNHSSLKYDFKSDSTEICKAMQNIDLSQYQVLVYKTIDLNNTGLYKFEKKSGGKNEFKEVNIYPRDITSTDSGRLQKVVEDALSLYPQATYDMIFWGHGTAWVEGNDNTDVQTTKRGPEKAYGGEYTGFKNPNGSAETSWMNIEDLSSALPNKKFDKIWFDCCYMSSIEVIYELRDKCNYYIGYPTEVMSEGMSYEVVLPYLLRKEPDFIGAAKSFFKNYNDHSVPATVTVLDMSKLPAVVNATREILKTGFMCPSSSDMVNYSRMSTKLVDFLTYYSEIANHNNRQELATALKQAYDKMVLYQDASAKDFRGFEWDRSKIHGISTFYLIDENDDNSAYYKNLEWYKTVYKSN
ncbi:MAG: hypothetical protein HDS84_08590 [Bacteroidales bacterium]|nr:hypothetical protein [Bacteroidales bacterium]